MFVSDKLIFLELRKTGCTHIIKLLQRVVEGKRKSKHNRLPRRFRRSGRSIIGSIRNPWDWYVSLWAFGCAGKGALFVQLAEHGFKDLYGDVKRPELFRRWLYFMQESRESQVFAKPFGEGSIADFAGFLSCEYAYLFASHVKPLRDGSLTNIDELVDYMATNDMKDYVIRREHLESDLLETLMRIGIHPNSDDRHQIWNQNRTNTSRRVTDPGYYYDRESIELVSRREQLILRRYHYEPPAT